MIGNKYVSHQKMLNTTNKKTKKKIGNVWNRIVNASGFILFGFMKQKYNREKDVYSKINWKYIHSSFNTHPYTYEINTTKKKIRNFLRNNKIYTKKIKQKNNKNSIEIG